MPDRFAGRFIEHLDENPRYRDMLERDSRTNNMDWTQQDPNTGSLQRRGAVYITDRRVSEGRATRPMTVTSRTNSRGQGSGNLSDYDRAANFRDRRYQRAPSPTTVRGLERSRNDYRDRSPPPRLNRANTTFSRRDSFDRRGQQEPERHLQHPSRLTSLRDYRSRSPPQDRMPRSRSRTRTTQRERSSSRLGSVIKRLASFSLRDRKR